MKIRITYNLEASSGILIGSTAEVLNIGIDKTTMRRKPIIEGGSFYSTREPIIPGSTLKGKIRSECERMLRSLIQNPKICQAPRPETMCPHGREDEQEPLCSVCQLFGGPTSQSRLFFADATAQISGNNKSREGRYINATRAQAGVALSRKRRTAEDERLYYIERGIEGITYQGVIDGYLDYRLANQQLALLIAAIERLVAIGGNKSRGAGWTRALIKSVECDTAINNEISLIREGLSAWQKLK